MKRGGSGKDVVDGRRGFKHMPDVECTCIGYSSGIMRCVLEALAFCTL